MEKEELIKKLEQAEIPEIEIPGHRTHLKLTLEDWYYHQRPSRIWTFKRSLVPLSFLAILLMVVLGLNNFVFPQYTLAQAMKIAREDPRVKTLIEENDAEIKDIKVVDHKAYALITEKEPESDDSISQESTQEPFSGALIEISLEEKKVARIEEILPESQSLSLEEKEKAKAIIRDSEPSEARAGIEFEKIESLPVPSYNLKLIKKNKGIEISAEQESDKAQIIYRVGKEIKQGQVDLREEKIEKTSPIKE